MSDLTEVRAAVTGARNNVGRIATFHGEDRENKRRALYELNNALAALSRIEDQAAFLREALTRIAALTELGYQYPANVAKVALSHLEDQAALPQDATEALEFYADPETYVAIGFLADRPAGAFMDDFDDTGELGLRPGKRARAALSRIALRQEPPMSDPSTSSGQALAEVRALVEEMARQKLCSEMDGDALANGDFYGAHDEFVMQSRKALAALSRIEKGQQE